MADITWDNIMDPPDNEWGNMWDDAVATSAGGNTIANDRTQRELADVIDRGSSTLLPALDTTTPVDSTALPRSIGEAVAQAAREGYTIPISETQWDDLDTQANLLALRQAKALGGFDKMGHGQFSDMQAGYRYYLARLHSMPTDEEAPAILNNAGIGIVSNAQNRLLAEAQELRAAIEANPDNRSAPLRLKKVNESLGVLQSEASRAAEGDPAFTNLMRESFSKSLRSADVEDLASNLTLNQLSPALKLKDTTKDVGAFGGPTDYKGFTMRRQDRFNDALGVAYNSNTQPKGRDIALRLAIQSGVEDVKLQQLGVSREQIEKFGITAAMIKNFPQTFIPPSGDVDISAQAAQSIFNHTTFGQQALNILEQANASAQEELEAFDPARLSTDAPLFAAVGDTGSRMLRGVGTAFMGALSVSGDILNGVGATVKQGLVNEGHTQMKPWEQTAADKEQIKAEIAAGDVEMGTILRFTKQDDNPIGVVLAHLLEHGGDEIVKTADYVRWTSTGKGRAQDDDKLGIGKIIASKLQEVPPESLNPVLARELLSETIEELKGNVLSIGGRTLNENRALAKQLGEMASNNLAKGDYVGAVRKTLVGAMFKAVAVDSLETVGLVINEPSAAAFLPLLGLGLNKGGGALFKHAKGGFESVAARATFNPRLRRAMGDYAAHDPKGLVSAIEGLKTDRIPGTPIAEAHMASIVGVMEKLADEAVETAGSMKNLTAKDHSSFWRKRRRTLRDLDRHLARLPDTGLEAVADRMGIADDVMRDIQNPVRVSMLGEFFNSAKSVMRINGHKLHSRTAKRNFNNWIGDIDGALNAGASLEQIESLPVPMVGTAEGYARWGSVMESVGKFLPTIGKLYKGPQAFAKAGLTYESMRWMREQLPDMILLRDHNMIIQGRQMDMLDLANRRLQMKRSAIETISPEMRSEAHIKELADISNGEAKLKFAADETRKRRWDQDVRLSKNDAVVDTLNFHDITAWHNAANGAGARREAWQALAKRDRLGTVSESPAQFGRRMQKIRDLEEGLQSGKIKRGAGKLRAEKQKFLNALYDREIPEKIMDLSDDTSSFNQAWVKKIEQLRRIADKKGDAEALATLPEIRKSTLRADRQEIETLAATMQAQHNMTGVLSRVGGWNFGRAGDMIDFMRQAALNTRGKMTAQRMSIENYNNELSKLAPEIQAEFDDMLFKASRGDHASYDEFFEKNPELRERLFESDKFGNLGSAFESMETMRADFLKRLHDVGMLPDGAYEQFIRPYSPQLYSADQTIEMANRALANKARKRALRERVEVSPTTGGVGRTDIFEVQRDMYQHRLLVRKNGSDWVDKKFRSAGEANRWVKRHMGVTKGKEYNGKTGAPGETNFGDEYRILEPLGEEFAADLGLIGRGAALGKQVASLMKEASITDLVKSIDRPGWTIHADLADSKIHKGFVDIAVPEGTTGFLAPLAGKKMHRKAAQMLRHVLEMDDMLSTAQKQLAETALSDASSLGHKAFAKLGAVIPSIGPAFRSLLNRNLIERNPATHFMNRWYDRQVLARAATDSNGAYLKSSLGRKAKKDAKTFLLGESGFDAGTNLADNLARMERIDPERGALFREAIEQGMIGETMLGNPVSGELSSSIAKTMFGDRDKVLFKTGERTISDRSAKTIQRLDRIQQIKDSPRWKDMTPETRNRLELESVTLEEVLKVEAPSPGRRAIDNIKWATGISNKKGAFDDANFYSHDLYAREGNIDRLGAYVYLRDKGLSKELATARVRDFMQDYSNLPGMVRMLRNNPLASPVFSFPAEWIRIHKNVMKQQPGYLVAMAGLAPALSFTSIAATGVDPVDYWMTRSKGNMIDAIVAATSTLTYIQPDGTLGEVEMPGMSPLMMMKRGTGAVGDVIDAMERGLDENTSFMANAGFYAGSMLARFTGNFVGSNPLTDFGYTMITGNDPMTKEQIGGGFMGNLAAGSMTLSRLAVPSVAPVLSSGSEGILDTLRHPPNIGTGRITSSAERILQAATGIRSRGGTLQDLGKVVESQTGADPINYGSQLVLDALNVPREMLDQFAGTDTRVESPTELARSQGYSDEDLITSLFFANKKYALKGSQPGHRIDDRIMSDARLAGSWIASDNPQLQDMGNRLLGKTRKALEESVKARKAFAGLNDLAIAEANREGKRILERAMKSTDLGEVFVGGDLNQQVRTLIGASHMGLNEGVLNELVQRIITVNKNDFSSTRSWSNPQAVMVASAHFDHYFKNAQPGATALPSLQWLQAHILMSLGKATQRQELDDASSAMTSDHIQIFERAR